MNDTPSKKKKKTKNPPPTELDMVARTMQVSCYSDMNAVEREIARILQCATGRTPTCLMTESYQRFRQDVLETVMMTSSRNSSSSSNSLHLDQGLVIRAIKHHHAAAAVTIQLVWKEACNPEAASEMGLLLCGPRLLLPAIE